MHNDIAHIAAERRRLAHARKQMKKKLRGGAGNAVAVVPKAHPVPMTPTEAKLFEVADQFLEAADQSALSPNPAERFAALHLYLIRSMLRGVANGAPTSETMGLRELNELMFEIAEGNFDDPRIPIPSGKGKGDATVRVYAALMGLMRLAGTAMAGTIADNAKKVVAALDRLLKDRDYSVEQWMEAHNKSKRAVSGNRAVARIVRWVEDGKCPCSDGPSYQRCASEFSGHAAHLHQQGASASEALDSLVLFTASLILKTAKRTTG